MPKVSIIIATYNRSDYVCQAIDSVLNQSYQDFELLIVDDGSTDNTAQVLKKYAGRLQYFYKPQGGPANAFNYGVRRSQGEYFAILGDDDTWQKGFLATVVRRLESHPQLAFVSTGAYMIDENGQVLREMQGGKCRPKTFLSLLEGNFIFQLTVLLRRKYYDELGGFDEELPTTNDYDLWLRLAAKYPFDCIDEPLANYRVHGANITKNLDPWLSDHLRLLNKPYLRNRVPWFKRCRLKSKVYFQFGQYYEQSQAYKKAGDCFLKSLLLNPLVGLNYWPPEAKHMRFSLPYRLFSSYTLPLKYWVQK